jgi:ketosteroid isomerase-like protein
MDMQTRDEKAAVIQMLRDYYAAATKQDLPGTVAYYHEPVTFITSRGVACFRTHDDAAPVLKQLFERFRELGVVRNDWAEAHCKLLGETSAAASVVVARYRADGQEAERVGWTYLMHKTGGEWKIAVLAGHPPDSILRID